MNGVDISDQYRSYYSTQLPVRRTWMPLFFWILDTTIINAYLIHQAQGGTLSHKEFRIEVAWALIHEGTKGASSQQKRTRQHHEDPTKKKKEYSSPYVTEKTELPSCRFQPGPHVPKKIEGRPKCFLCRYNAVPDGEDVRATT
ncbi:hypothetical protein BG015_006603, partial [Linnemannia schmuckeri]